MRIVGLQYLGRPRCAVVEGAGWLRLLSLSGDIYHIAKKAIDAGMVIESLIKENLSDNVLDYNQALAAGCIRLPIMHPDPAHCLVSGTGLTHTGSAETRNIMHKRLEKTEYLSDSMKMFQVGLLYGKPSQGVGAEPEWFYKGDGDIVVAPNKDLPVPSFAEDAGEEPELAAIYLIDENGQPQTIGYAIGNEFSDHVKERQNYLLLAHSKLRACSIGPEIYLGELPASLEGVSRIFRNNQLLWEKPFLTGEDNMVHSLANLKHHHFKYAQFRRPGDLHIHFLGTATLSFSDDIVLEDGDVVEIELPFLGKPLRNSIKFEP